MTVARRLALAAGVLLAGAVAVAPVLAASASVTIRALEFEPATISIAPGDTVTWTVEGAIIDSHSVTAGSLSDPGDLFDSKVTLKATGDTFEFTFQEAGEYAYYCIVHPIQMTGTVIVGTPTATEGPGEGEGSGESGGVAPERKALAGGILVLSIALMFAGAVAWRRMNPA